jgi:excisionase family DNA binding protein
MKLYTPQEVAELAGVTKDLIYKLIRKGELAHCYFGSLIRIREEELHKYVDERTVKRGTKQPREGVERDDGGFHAIGTPVGKGTNQNIALGH